MTNDAQARQYTFDLFAVLCSNRPHTILLSGNEIRLLDMLITQYELHAVLLAKCFELVGELLGETIVEKSGLSVNQGDLLSGVLAEDFLTELQTYFSCHPIESSGKDSPLPSRYPSVPLR
jgi:hypothetical protein